MPHCVIFEILVHGKKIGLDLKVAQKWSSWASVHFNNILLLPCQRISGKNNFWPHSGGSKLGGSFQRGFFKHWLYMFELIFHLLVVGIFWPNFSWRPLTTWIPWSYCPILILAHYGRYNVKKLQNWPKSAFLAIFESFSGGESWTELDDSLHFHN